MKFIELNRNITAKAVIWYITDAIVRRHRDQTGLETPVVYAVKYEY